MSTRREFIKQASLIAGISLTASMGLASLSSHAAQKTAGGNWRMPDEGEPQQCAFIAFGAQRAIWGAFTADVQDALPVLSRFTSR